MEATFCAAYLLVAFIIGILTLARSGAAKASRLFGIMILVLAGGDAFHLLPRISGALSGVRNITALGFGTMVTSFTMTAFYVLMFYFIALAASVKNYPVWRNVVLIVAAIRVVLLCFPQNNWLAADSPVSWGIYRNIPFIVLGAADAALLFKYFRKDRFLKFAWAAVVLSFVFYMPAALSIKSMAGMFMILKTLCYIWLMIAGLRHATRNK
jgi:hypothetical protein